MAICYKRLWKLLIDRDLKKTDLCSMAGISSSTLSKLTHDKTVQSDVLDRICLALGCGISDIMEVERDGVEEFSLFPSFLPQGDGGEDAPYSVVSLFSGCGGLDLGFRGGFSFLGREYEKNPFEIVWANEMNKAACATYRANVDERIVEGPIQEHFLELPNYADVVVGGFPCQDISINGKMVGVDGKRSGLYIWMVKTVAQLRPKIFVAENVKALLMKRHETSLQRVIHDFSELGYNISYQLYDVSDYGVPQNRERVIIVGVRKDIDIPFVPPVGKTVEKKVTSWEAIHDLEDRPEDAAFSHIWSAAKPSSGQGLRYIAADSPATTIRSECHGNIQFHYKLPRRLSMREAARIQSFPDDFLFKAKIRETERMIGNAVPPVFAWHIAQSVLDVLQATEQGKKEQYEAGRISHIA